MSQSKDFSSYGTAGSEGAEEAIWHVAFAADDIKLMTLDQLDEAFAQGMIDARTVVWTEGMADWAPLGEVADLGAAGPESATTTSADSAAPGQEQARVPQQSGSWADTWGAPPPSARGVIPPADPALVSDRSWAAREEAPPTAAAEAPAVSRVPAFSQFAPRSGAVSTAPFELSIESGRGASKKSGLGRWVLAVTGVAAAGLIAFNNRDAGESSAHPVSEAPPPPDSKPSMAARLQAVESEAKTEVHSNQPAAPSKPDGEASAAGGAIKPASLEVAAAPVSKGTGEAKEAVEGDKPTAKETEKKSALQRSVVGALSKESKEETKAESKARSSKAAKAAKRSTRTSAKSAKKPVVSSSPGANSAFDPLNDSLP